MSKFILFFLVVLSPAAFPSKNYEDEWGQLNGAIVESKMNVFIAGLIDVLKELDEKDDCWKVTHELMTLIKSFKDVREITNKFPEFYVKTSENRGEQRPITEEKRQEYLVYVYQEILPAVNRDLDRFLENSLQILFEKYGENSLTKSRMSIMLGEFVFLKKILKKIKDKKKVEGEFATKCAMIIVWYKKAMLDLSHFLQNHIKRKLVTSRLYRSTEGALFSNIDKSIQKINLTFELMIRFCGVEILDPVKNLDQKELPLYSSEESELPVNVLAEYLDGGYGVEDIFYARILGASQLFLQYHNRIQKRIDQDQRISVNGLSYHGQPFWIDFWANHVSILELKNTKNAVVPVFIMEVEGESEVWRRGNFKWTKGRVDEDLIIHRGLQDIVNLEREPEGLVGSDSRHLMELLSSPQADEFNNICDMQTTAVVSALEDILKSESEHFHTAQGSRVIKATKRLLVWSLVLGDKTLFYFVPST